MRELGVSVYPFHSKMEDNKSYLKLASSYGFTRCFMCLVSVDSSRSEIIKEFGEIIRYAKELGIRTTIDISPAIFKKLEISYEDLSFFRSIGAWAVRLDIGFGGSEESLMTFNEYDLKIELNMSNDTSYLETIIGYSPNVDNLIGCHNFYPHNYSGLGRDFFIRCTSRFKKYAISASAFINAKEASFGQWPVSDGICTLEEHRNLPIEVQAMDLFSLGMDCVFISNCYANEESFKKLSSLDKRLITLKSSLFKNIPKIERSIILNEMHFNRGDVSDNLIRSSMPRVKYNGNDFKIFNTPDIKRGDILIDSSLYGHYAGEMQIALKDMKNSGRTNVVGRIEDDYITFLDRIKPWEKFKIIEK